MTDNIQTEEEKAKMIRDYKLSRMSRAERRQFLRDEKTVATHYNGEFRVHQKGQIKEAFFEHNKLFNEAKLKKKQDKEQNRVLRRIADGKPNAKSYI